MAACCFSASFPNNLHQHPLPSLTVELAVEDLFPGAKVETAAGYSGYYLTAHDAAFQVGVGVDFAGVVMVGSDRLVGGKFFKPDVKVMVKAGFVVVDKNAGCDVHGIYQN